jgi:amidohydrolase
MLEYVASIHDELIAIRRDLHRHPELKFDIDRTAGIAAQYLEDWGLEVERGVGPHFGKGVVGTLRGRTGGKTVLLRADMDALPIQEGNETPYKSFRAGIMHACGHDAHTAMLLGAAKTLSRFRERLTGTVKFVFQPCEEGPAASPLDGHPISGARDLIEGGILEGVDLCFALHVSPGLPVGTVGVHPKHAMAGGSGFRVEFQGKSGHHSTPHLAVDAILMVAQFITEMKTVMSSEINPVAPAVLSFGTLHAGTARNVIAEQSVIDGSFRTFDPAITQRIKQAIERRAHNIADSYGGKAVVEVGTGGTGLVNHKEAVRLVLRAGSRALGADRTFLLETPSLAGEDFSQYLYRVPGALAFIGSGNPDRGIIHSVHHPLFDIDEQVLVHGAGLHVELVREILAGNGESEEEVGKTEGEGEYELRAAAVF